tara:strand:+ start:10424 stop:10873 length:450 start_codon:yes stop_codon:yes gene_type:complete
MKKILLITCIILLNSCVGYKPIFSNKDINFQIVQITNTSNDNISKQIIKNLKPYTTKNDKTEILLEIKSQKIENILSRDAKGDPLLHEIRVKSEIKIEKKNEEKILKFNEFFNFNNQTNKFEFSQYKKNIQKNLANRIFEKLILELQKI